MFRRRPVLATALVVGASRSAARHEVEKQGQRSTDAQLAATQAAEKKKRDEEEMDKRTQLAIDEAIQKERNRVELTEAQKEQSEVTMVHLSSEDVVQDVSLDRDLDSKDIEKAGADTRYCTECGYLCKVEHKFCSSCGFKQPLLMQGGG